MKFRYSKYTGNLLDEIDFDDLVSKLSDLLLSSGFSNPWGDPFGSDDDRSMQALHDAILDALFNGGVLPEETLEKLLGDPADADQAGQGERYPAGADSRIVIKATGEETAGSFFLSETTIEPGFPGPRRTGIAPCTTCSTCSTAP